MNHHELREALLAGALGRYTHLYKDIEEATKRYLAALDAFTAFYGEREEIFLFSVPGRSEVSGNHTDHNHGKVLAAAIDRDIIAVVSPTDDGVIAIKSKSYPEDKVALSDVSDRPRFKKFTSAALVAGTADGFRKRGYALQGFVAYTSSDVPTGSGLSSSAAFEVMVGNILNHLANGGTIPAETLAKIAQYAENEYFGKPCGLMDQMACAVGGFVSMDFENPSDPIIEPIDFSLSDAELSLCIVGTGGSHANLNANFAAVTAEMRAVAGFFGKEVLRGITEEEILHAFPDLRHSVGDRALLRAIHFVRENLRVERQTAALRRGDVDAFLDDVLKSGDSSYKYLQNVYAPENPAEQGLSLALACAEGFLSGKRAAWRVHGGGFAGTVQVFLPTPNAEEFKEKVNALFGKRAAMLLTVRSAGAIKISL